MFGIPVNMQPLALAAFLMLALAGWLLWIDVGKTVNRVFAALLAIRALSFILAIWRGVRFEAGEDVYAINLLFPYAIIPLLPISIYFICVYPRRRWLGTWKYGGPATVVATLAMLVWYALDTAAYGNMVVGQRNSFNVAIGPYIIDPLGPLFAVNSLRVLVWGLIGFVLALDYVREEQGAKRNALFLVMMAFVLNNLLDGARELYQRIDTWESWTSLDMLPWTWAPAWLPMLALVPTVGAMGVVGWHGLRHAERGPRRVAAGFLAACAAPITTAIMVEAGLGAGFIDAETFRIFILSIWRVTIPVFVTYALLRYGIFDINIKLKAGVRRGIIVGVFGLTFFVVSEATESLVLAGGGTAFGLMAAGLLSTANRPLERMAQGAADRMMPLTKPLDQLTAAEKHELYREQMALVMQDDKLSAKERRMLDQLALALGFPDDEKEALEAGNLVDVEEPPVVGARERPKASFVFRAVLAAGVTAMVFGIVSQGIEMLIPLTNQQAGLLTAGLVAILLARVEDFAARLTGSGAALGAEQADTLRVALVEAWSDGVLSARDKQFLAELETRLGVTPTQRLRIERDVKRNLGLRRWGGRPA